MKKEEVLKKLIVYYSDYLITFLYQKNCLDNILLKSEIK